MLQIVARCCKVEYLSKLNLENRETTTIEIVVVDCPRKGKSYIFRNFMQCCRRPGSCNCCRNPLHGLQKKNTHLRMTQHRLGQDPRINRCHQNTYQKPNTIHRIGTRGPLPISRTQLLAELSWLLLAVSRNVTRFQTLPNLKQRRQFDTPFIRWSLSSALEQCRYLFGGEPVFPCQQLCQGLWCVITGTQRAWDTGIGSDVSGLVLSALTAR